MTTTALPTRTDVAIVGAGPTGLALAVTLAAAGIEFVIVDRLAEGANTSRAAVVHARTLEVLDELGAAQALIARGVPINRFVVRDGSRRLLTVPFDGLPTPYPYSLMVPQCETESVLLARLRALGHDVHRPYEVGSVVQDEDCPAAGPDGWIEHELRLRIATHRFGLREPHAVQGALRRIADLAVAHEVAVHGSREHDQKGKKG